MNNLKVVLLTSLGGILAFIACVLENVGYYFPGVLFGILAIISVFVASWFLFMDEEEDK